MSKTESSKRIIKRIFSFGKLALILGFIVDSITLASILLAIDFDSSELAPSGFVTPGLAFIIWLLGVYTYLAFLHTYWDKHQVEKDLAETFGRFLSKDLIFRFRSPWLLFPGFVSAVSLGWIIYSVEPGLLIGVPIAAVFIGIFWAMYRSFNWSPSSVGEKFKKRVEENWSFLEERIEYRLAEQQWVSYYELEDIAVIWGIDLENMRYVLAKYAVEHPDRTRYGQVCRRETGNPVSSDSVLINLQNVNRDKYYWLQHF